MFANAKPLIVVFALALVAFYFAKPVCVRYMTEEAFKRRRNVWLALTVVAFLSPSFWLYALFALFILLWAGGRDDNPLALYVLVTFTVPSVSFYIPVPFVNQLFDLTQYRIMSLAILVPAVFRLQSANVTRSLRFPDVLLLAFLLLQVFLLMPYESFTNTMRRTFLFGIDTFIVFYAFSRLADRDRIADVMACFWIGLAVMAPIAVFESLRGWLLYQGLSSVWGDPNVFAFLLRGDSLRAQAGANHSINLGYHLALSLGLFLYLRERAASASLNWLIIITLAAGIIVTYSRGAWITAVLIALLFVASRPNAVRRLGGALVLSVCVLALMYVTPLKESVIDRLPFIGSAQQDTVDYRQQLAEVSWVLIKQNPLFGDPFAYRHMESLRQGQGIIDIINGYIYTALFTGFAGLGLQVGVFLTSLARGFRAFLAWRIEDRDTGLLGAALVACMTASLIFIATAAISTTTYVLCGLLMSYSASRSRTMAGAASYSGRTRSATLNPTI